MFLRTIFSRATRAAKPTFAASSSLLLEPICNASSNRMRKFSVTPLPGQLPQTDHTISMEQAIGTSETVLLYLAHGKPGLELDALRANNQGDGVGKRYRAMMHCFLQTQLHVIVPFGFTPSEQGVQDFAAALMKLMQGYTPTDADVLELQKISTETMDLMLNRAFGITEVPKLSIDKIRYLSSLISSNVQDENFLKHAEALYKEKVASAGSDQQKLMEAHAQLQDELLVPCYMSVIKQGNATELGSDELGYVMLQTLTTQHSGDMIVAQNMSSALMTLNARAPIMPMPGQA